MCCVLIGFLCALAWARAKDPFQRVPFFLRNNRGEKASGMAVLGKPVSPDPVVVYLGSAGALEKNGPVLRQFAELGLAAITMEFNLTNSETFDAQCESLLDYIKNQPWAQTNAVAWFCCGLSADRLLKFTRAHPQFRPALFVSLGGTFAPEMHTVGRPSKQFFGTRMLLVQGRQDSVFPFDDCKRLAAALRAQGAVVDLFGLKEKGHELDDDAILIHRVIAEYCARQFGLSGQRLHEFEHSHWHYWLPAFGAITLLLATRWRKLRAAAHSTTSLVPKHVHILSIFSRVIGLFAVSDLVLHLALPLFPVSHSILGLARCVLVPRASLANFDTLASDKAWEGQRLRGLLEHAELANLQSRQFYTNLPEPIYREFVLSPRLAPGSLNEWNWRRELWEAFYPRVRNERYPAAAAGPIARFMRERVGIDPAASGALGIQDSWQKGMTDADCFEQLYISALRSVGIAARLGPQRQAELWTGERWVLAPEPFLKYGIRPEESIADHETEQ